MRKGKMFKKKQIEKICKNCKLFNPDSSTCSIVILHEGERLRLPVLENEPCFFEGEFFDEATNETSNFVDDVKEVKMWVEDENGKKTNKEGTVKIEYPDGFFGKDDASKLIL